MIGKQVKQALNISLMWTVLVCSTVIGVPNSVFAVDGDELLPADQAFVASASVNEQNEVVISWGIAEGYYLYKHAFRFTVIDDGVELGDPIIPTGKRYDDEFFGEVETYREQVVVNLPIIESAGASELTVQVSYQGCADLGVCYPPVKKELIAVLPDVNAADLIFSGTGTGADNVLAGLGQSSGSLLDAANDEALPAEQAFQYEAIAISGNELLVRMTAAPGYYLYRDKLAFATSADNLKILSVALPAGQKKHDEHFGDVEVYYDQIEIPVTLQRTTGSEMQAELQGDFQGCKEKGICYPPMSRKLSVDIPEFSGFIGTVDQTEQSSNQENTQENDQVISEQDHLAAILAGSPMRAMLLFFLAGLLLAFTPCVFPMIPILSGIIAGQGEKITTRKALLLSVVYVLAMSLTYASAGVFAGMSGSNLQAAFQNPWIISAFSLLFVALAMSMFGFYELQLPASWQARLSSLSNRQQGGKLTGVAVMGVLSALIVGPCVAPALAAALIYIGQTGNAVLGGTALFAMALGMGIPLIIFGVSAGSLLPRAGGWMDTVKAVFGVSMLGLAIWMLERILPGSIILLMWSVLFIGTGIYLCRLSPAKSSLRILWKALGILSLLFGGLQMLSFTMGGDDWTRPLRGVNIPGIYSNSIETTEIRHFERIKTVADLRARLGQGQPVIFDFYADWCVECKRMEKYTFPEPQVQEAMQNALLLQADVTANDAEDQALLQEFGLIGPPAILFFSADGEQQRAGQLIGYLDADAFAEHTNRWVQ